MPADEQQFHIARSLALDAFAQCEAAITVLIEKFAKERPCSSAPLGQRIDALAKLKPAPQLSKKRKAAIDDALVALRPLLAVRADIVHSTQAVLKTKPATAIYRNAATLGEPYPTARILTLEQMGSLSADTRRIADRLVGDS